MKPLTLRLSLAVAFAATLVVPAAAQSEGVAWRSSFEAARAEAAQTGKLVLAHFWTESCGPCRALEQRVFAQPQVAVALSDQFVPVKINANESPELAKAFGVTRVPTDAIVTADGRLVRAFVSPAQPMEYVGVVSQIAAAHKSSLGAGYDAIARNAPFAPQTAGQPQGAPLSGAMAAPPVAPFGAQTPGLAAAAPAVSPAPAAMQNPHMVPQGTPQAPAESQIAAAPARQPQAQPAAVQLPPGSPPLGFEGYCPVTMKNEWRWARGDVRFGAIHEGRTYLFASAEAQRAFLATPAAFSPVLAGSDPVAAIDQSRNVAGSREFAVEYEGRFYLFANEQSLEKFWTNPAGYAQGAERIASRPLEAAPGGSMLR